MADGETLNFPVLLWHPDGQRVAVDGQALPVLSAGRHGDLGQAVREAWQVEAWLLDDAGLPFGRAGTPQLRALTEELPPGFTWQEKEVTPLPYPRVWQRPDWPERLQARLAQAGLGGCRVAAVYSNDLTSIVRVQRPEGEAFLKTSASPQEARFTRYVADHLPHLCPPLLAADVEEGWQVTACGGTLLDAVAGLGAWEQAVRRLTEFQQTANAEELARLGAPAYPFRDMPERVAAFLGDTAVLRGWGLPPESIQALQQARPRIKRAFQGLAQLNLPDRPAHGDAHVRNALHGLRGSVWFDWSEVASAAHPFMDMGWFLAFALHPARETLPVRQAHADLEGKLVPTALKAYGLPETQAPLLSAAIPLAYLYRATLYDEKFREWQGNVPGWRPNYVPYYLKQAVQELHRLPG